MSERTTPSYVGLQPASANARKAAQGASRKRDTACELLLRRELRRLGVRSYRVACSDLPGKPDLVFRGMRLAVFCDGDFWHGRNLAERLAKLAVGHNPGYWVKKIQRNVERDRANELRLEAEGWQVLRFWETDIRSDPEAAARMVMEALDVRSRQASPRARATAP